MGTSTYRTKKVKLLTSEKCYETLESYIVKSGGAKYKIINEIYKSVKNGKIKIIDPNPPKTFLSFIKSPAYSIWFHTSITILVTTILSIYLTNVFPVIKFLRYVLGFIYILFLPGYSLVEALYPEEKSLSPLERMALSIGLSIVLIPLVGLVLNYTPWGITLDSITISTSILTLSLLVIAEYRKYIIHKLRYRIV